MSGKVHLCCLRAASREHWLIIMILQLSDKPDHPPTGYVFVPKGDVYVTRNWYERLRKWHENAQLTPKQSRFDK